MYMRGFAPPRRTTVPPVTLAHPAFFAIALTIAVAASLLLLTRRSHSWLILLGLLSLATVAGGPLIPLYPPKQNTVLVDLSPSTRTAAYRDRSALLHRINELTGNVPVQIMSFAEHLEPLPATSPLSDISCDQTNYTPPMADAVLLFSDGRFTPPDAGDPTYPVIDPLLIDPPDAAITEMHFDGSIVAATVQNRGDARQLIWSGTTQTNSISVPTGTSIIRGGRATASIIQARLNSADPWPENDSLILPAPTPQTLQYWWNGTSAPPIGWTPHAPSDLPTDPSAYLAAGAIALANVPATDLSDTQQQRLTQYVRDLGGSLLIFGGDHAFAAGGYTGTELDSLSPLASAPPTPATHWILLVDSSGSMAESSNGLSHWQAAVQALLRLLPSLPPKDPVSIGSFARDLSWWIDGQPADIAKRLTAPPPRIAPNGPTNLQPVLEQLARRRTDSVPTELLLLTDADTIINDPLTLAAALDAAKVRVSLLALGNVSPSNPVVQIVTATRGHWIANDDPSRWIDSLRDLLRSASPTHIENETVTVRFDSSLNLPGRQLDSWNRAWIKTNATQLAATDLVNQPAVELNHQPRARNTTGPAASAASDARELQTTRLPLAARWQIGLGSVAAFAFTPTPSEVTALTQQFAAPPRDPRFKVTWQCDSTIKVSVDASTEAGYLNGLHFVLKLGDQSPQPLNQTEPGRYSLELPAARSPALATIQLDGHVIDRHAIAGRYAPEFDAIGNDDAALAQLAARTGGHLIPPTQHTPIVFNWPPKLVRIDSYLAASGAILLAIGIIRLRSTSSTPVLR
jgi:hypothetical protein